jgi:hypothetical protein
LFISIRSAASCGQPLQESVAPRGALTCRLRMFIRMLIVRVPGFAALSPMRAPSAR